MKFNLVKLIPKNVSKMGQSPLAYYGIDVLVPNTIGGLSKIECPTV